MRVTAITHRNDPILTMVSVGVPMDENHSSWGVSQSLGIKRRLKEHGVPVIDVFMPPETTGHMIAVSVAAGGRKVAEQIGQVLTARRTGLSKIMVVDSDVNVFDLAEVAHAFATKCHPERGIIVINTDGKANPVTPCYSAEERKALKGATVVFDCTWPADWTPYEIPVKSSFTSIYPQEMQDRVVKNWKKYGFTT
jgi:4-hydroxy-3-polyprenylbenzoate decarboxylase